MYEKLTYEELEKRVQDLEQSRAEISKDNQQLAEQLARTVRHLSAPSPDGVQKPGGGLALSGAGLDRELVEERHRLYTLFDALPLYIHLQTADYRIIYANRVFQKHVGPWQGRTCHECFHGLPEPCSNCPAERVLNHGGHDIRVWRNKAGRYFEVYNYPFTDVDGSPLILELGIDITDRVRSENEHKKLENQLRTLATTDPLTGACNRRHFLCLAEKELRRCLRYQSPFTLCVLDIDHFKRVNDQHGHKAGDLVLQQLVQFFDRRLRCSDIFGRWGGEEFVFVLVENSLNEALAACDQLRRDIAARSFGMDCCPNLKITVSMGLANVCGPDASLEMVINQADAALYAAKEAGRNQVRYHQG